MSLARQEAFRKALLPKWVRAFAWLFLVMGSATPAMLVSGLFYPDAMQFSLFGWEHTGSPYDAYSLFVVAYFAASGAAAFGLLWGRRWGWAAGFIVGSIGLALALGSMFVQPLVRGNDDGYTVYFRLEPLLQIPFLYVLWRIRKAWLSPSVVGDDADVQRSNAPRVIAGLVCATSLIAILAVALVSSLTSGMIAVAGEFFEAVKANDVAKARALLSSEAQAATDENALRQFLVTSDAFGFKSANWPGRRILGQRGELKGSITSSNGEVPMVLTFVKEDGRWKILHLARPAVAPKPQDLRALRARAEGGEASAQAELAEDYLAGSGVEKNGAEAAKWLRKAAEQGFARAQYNLGVLYDDGLGVPKDKAQAIAWYRKAAEQGHVRAQHNLAYSYAHGDGVARDDAQAIGWYRKAADQGFAKSQFQLGALYAGGSAVARDDAEAVAWFRKAAEQGLAEAQFEMGEACAEGRGVPQDDKSAVEWYRQAADQGLAKAQDKLAMTYSQGRGIARNAKEAYYWWLLGARNDEAKRDRLGEARMPLTADEITEVEDRVARWRPKSARSAH